MATILYFLVFLVLDQIFDQILDSINLALPTSCPLTLRVLTLCLVGKLKSGKALGILIKICGGDAVLFFRAHIGGMNAIYMAIKNSMIRL